jgi:integrase
MAENSKRAKLPAVELRKKDGNWLPCFYARVYLNGVSKVKNTYVKWRGTPPEFMRDAGDEEFEESRTKAGQVAARYRKETADTGEASEQKEFVIEAKTGERSKDTAISRLPEILKAIEHRRERSKSWESWKTTVVSDFVSWAKYRKIQTVFGVTRKTVKQYMDFRLEPNAYGKVRTTKTVGDIKMILGNLFAEVLPEWKSNPWRMVKLETPMEDKEFHRKPLSEPEVARLLEVAEDDPLIHDLFVLGLSTGLRRGDCCKLTWKSVDLANGHLTLSTSKTQSELELPIMPKLREVLEGRLAQRKDKAKYVFPEAERLLREAPSNLTWRVKKAFALAFQKPQEAAVVNADTPERVALADVLPRVLKALDAEKMPAARRERITALLQMYAAGKGYRLIQNEYGMGAGGGGKPLSRGTISLLLHEAESLAKVRFLREQGTSMRKLVGDVTRTKRSIGMRSASRYDFHCLRTTFVTTALQKGLSETKLRALTGHTTVDLVIRHYFKPRGKDVASELEAVMPIALTGRKIAKPIAVLPETVATESIAEIMAKLEGLTEKQKKSLAAMLAHKGTPLRDSAKKHNDVIGYGQRHSRHKQEV